MNRFCTTTIILSAILLTNVTIHSKQRPEKKIEPKHITLEISRSATNQLHNNLFIPKSKKTIKELHEHVATIENSRVFGAATTHNERALINELEQYRKNQKLHVTVQAVSSNGTKETLHHFVMAQQGAKVPLTIPAIIPGKFRNEKTQSILVSIAPTLDVTSARKHDLVREQEHQFKKLYNNETLHFSPSDYAAKKYKPKAV